MVFNSVQLFGNLLRTKIDDPDWKTAAFNMAFEASVTNAITPERTSTEKEIKTERNKEKSQRESEKKGT